MASFSEDVLDLAITSLGLPDRDVGPVEFDVESEVAATEFVVDFQEREMLLRFHGNPRRATF